jgi:GTP-binding protein
MAPGQYPRWNRIEVAVAGRSNVGKSSILNALTGNPRLARISKTPGRTRAVNYFGIGSNLALVDLPGYGYAKMSKAEAAKISELMKDYLTRSEQLAALILLIDVRRGPGETELELIAGIPEQRRGRGGKPLELVIAATKTDKLRRTERLAALKRFANFGLVPVMCSAHSGEGIDELRRRIVTVAESVRRSEN